MENQTENLVAKSKEVMNLLKGYSYSDAVFVLNYAQQSLGIVAIVSLSIDCHPS